VRTYTIPRPTPIQIVADWLKDSSLTNPLVHPDGRITDLHTGEQTGDWKVVHPGIMVRIFE
jgi:hypothetical protein